MKGIRKKQFSHIVQKSSCQGEIELHIPHDPHRIQCCYTNSTPQLQIVRVANVCSGFLERAVMPNAKIVFEAHQDDHLEIHMGNPISTILSDRIPCHRLAYEGEHL